MTKKKSFRVKGMIRAGMRINATVEAEDEDHAREVLKQTLKDQFELVGISLNGLEFKEVKKHE